MKRTLQTLVSLAIIAAFAGSSYADDATSRPAQEKEAHKSKPNLTGEFGTTYQGTFVNGDRGRFREDHYRTDESTGGLDWFRLSTLRPDESGYEYSVEARAIYDYDYRVRSLFKKKDVFYLKADFTGFRRYNDGSNEFWNTGSYLLPKSFAEMDDGGIFLDRRTYGLEFGLTPKDLPHVVFGWQRYVRRGDELLLRGERARITGDPVPRFRGVPAHAFVDGVTDTYYIDISHTFAEKHNVVVRQEFEEYRDHQTILFPRYKDGALEQFRTFVDDPGYRSYNTKVMYDSFLDEQTYVTANYMYSYINNDTTRKVIRPGDAIPNFFINTETSNKRGSNVWAAGFRRGDLLKDLHVSIGVRVEESRTDSSSEGISKNIDLRSASTRLNEVRVGESARFVFEGIKDTTISGDIVLEQRELHQAEDLDTRSHEIFTDFGGPASMSRRADILHQDQTYTLKAVRRFNSAVKSTLKYRIFDFDRNYTERRDSDPVFFPGTMGDYRRYGNDVTASVDWRLNSKVASTLMYQFAHEGIKSALGGKTSNFDVHRGSGSFTLNPVKNLVLVPNFVVENYTIRTPGAGGGGSKIAPGSGAFDFVGSSFSVVMDATYAFSKRTSLYGSFRHTEALASGDFGGDNNYNQAGIGLKFKPADNQTVNVGYEFRNFNNHPGGNFDDYTAHSVTVSYAWAF